MRTRSIHHRLLRAILVGCGGAGLGVGVAGAQSFNVDIDSPTSGPTLGGGVPSPSFGAAANQPGFWTSYPATSNLVPLVDLLTGAPTTVGVQVTATSTSIAVLAFNNPANTGDFALLFNDGSQIGTTTQGGNRTYSFTGLINGPYEVYTYTGRPQGTEGELQVDVIGSAQGPITAFGTPVGNTFTPGVTHVVHTVNVTNGNIDVRLVDNPGAPAGYVGGFQLTLVPEPTGSIGLALLLPVARRRR